LLFSWIKTNNFFLSLLNFLFFHHFLLFIGKLMIQTPSQWAFYTSSVNIISKLVDVDDDVVAVCICAISHFYIASLVDSCSEELIFNPEHTITLSKSNNLLNAHSAAINFTIEKACYMFTATMTLQFYE